MSRKQKKALARILAAAALTILVSALPVTGIFRFLLFLIPYLIVGYNILWSAARNIVNGQIFDENFLMSIATLGAFSIGEYTEAAAVMLFYQVGEFFQSLAIGKSRDSIAALMDIRPDYAVVLRDGEEMTVFPDEVAVGEILIIKPGEKIPLDGEIIKGTTSVNNAALTGESLPEERATGARVLSGSINLTGVIHVRTTSSYNNSTVAKILELVENSTENKAKADRFITRFARYYTPCVVIAAALLSVLPPLLFAQPWSEWIHRALVFLVVSCPCALVVSIPLSFFGGIGGASREGILIKGANYLEVLSGIDTIVFDKTGTLTKGSFTVNAIHPIAVSDAELLDIAAAAESYSIHPVAEPIIAAYGANIDKSRISNVQEIAGMGVKAVIDGKLYLVGNSSLMKNNNICYQDCHLSGTVIHVARPDEYLGHIVINDEVKPDSAETIRSLHQLGIKNIIMLSGDHKKAAEAVGSSLGIERIHAELLPGEKAEIVDELIKNGCKTVFVGDGINDAPVIARADVGIAMGALGSDAAIEAADIVLMDDNPLKVPKAIQIARRTMRIVRQNILFSLAVKGIILLLGALGMADMWFAVFGDVGVMILAILNAMRAMIKRPSR